MRYLRLSADEVHGLRTLPIVAANTPSTRQILLAVRALATPADGAPATVAFGAALGLLGGVAGDLACRGSAWTSACREVSVIKVHIITKDI